MTKAIACSFVDVTTVKSNVSIKATYNHCLPFWGGDRCMGQGSPQSWFMVEGAMIVCCLDRNTRNKTSLNPFLKYNGLFHGASEAEVTNVYSSFLRMHCKNKLLNCLQLTCWKTRKLLFDCAKTSTQANSFFLQCRLCSECWKGGKGNGISSLLNLFKGCKYIFPFGFFLMRQSGNVDCSRLVSHNENTVWSYWCMRSSEAQGKLGGMFSGVFIGTTRLNLVAMKNASWFLKKVIKCSFSNNKLVLSLIIMWYVTPWVLLKFGYDTISIITSIFKLTHMLVLIFNIGGFLLDFIMILGGIKYDQIYHYVIDRFHKIHPFLNICVLHQ
ncbi:hypothetical protein VP01_2472g2 [Puccinia sorghi]|uniref:Uncharacterized protein n=1 Tax=Puccinia sorghi TaxID=27349 RepID=A0A0L6V650_9BASI|nr:hypothetical protein VP01_2472g2 [Puccinia sorghi]